MLFRSKLAKEYADIGDDFGFSAVSEEEYNQKMNTSVNKAAETISDSYVERLQALEKIIVPFLQKLHSTGDKEYIYWPNRKPVIEEQIAKILKLTRE